MTVTVEQIETTVGRTLSTIERTQAELWISDAAVVIGHGPDGHTAIDLASLDQGTLDMVIREAVADRLKHPDAVSRVSISVDDAQTTRDYVASSGTLKIRDEWWAMLLPAVEGDAFTVPLAYHRGHHHRRPPLSQPFWEVNP